MFTLFNADDTPSHAAPTEQTLSNIQVSGIRKQTNINYTVPTSRAATGMDLTLRETPQSLSVMTEKQISDQGVESLQDALNQMAGVYHSKMGNNATGDSQFASREMPIDTFNIDGAQKFYYTSQAIRRSTNNLDSGLYEQISVVRGTSGLSNGGLAKPAAAFFSRAKSPPPSHLPLLKPKLAHGNTRA